MKRRIFVLIVILLITYYKSFSTIVVNSNLDPLEAGKITLRDAIASLNGSGGGTITFAITGSTTISLASALPPITSQIIIDGTSQSGYASGSPVITIDGQNASISGIVFNGGGAQSEIIGIKFTGFGYGNATAFEYAAIQVSHGQTSLLNAVTIQDNVIVNSQFGVFIGASALLKGNVIGFDPNNNTAIPNKYGIVIHDPVSYINVGLSGNSSYKNFISGNYHDGILARTSTPNVVISNNVIGLDKYEFTPIPNSCGIRLKQEITGIMIGSHTAVGGNIISGNTDDGIIIENGHDIFIDGNMIGTNSSGLSLGNGKSGILISKAPGFFGIYENWIGRLNNTTGIGNIIQFNGEDGIQVLSPTVAMESSYNSILGNIIGFHSNGKAINLNYVNLFPGNLAKMDPTITSASVSGGSISGATSPAVVGHIIEVFSCDASGNIIAYLGEDQTNGSGNWTVSGLNLVGINYVIATCSEYFYPQTGGSNTSELSEVFELHPCAGLSLSAAFTMYPQNGLVNQNATLTYTGSGSNIVSFTIDWGDGSPQTTGGTLYYGDIFTHQYLSSGLYTINMTVYAQETGCEVTSILNYEVEDCCTGKLAINPPSGESVSDVGQFYFDNQTGRLVYVKHDCPAVYNYHCVGKEPQIPGATNVISATMKTMNDVWQYDLNYYLPANSIFIPNEFESAMSGRWRVVDKYVYREDLDDAIINTTTTADYKNFDRGTFSIAMFDWDYPGNNDPEHWIRQSRINYYTPNGQVEEDVNLRGIYSTAIYGYDKQLPIAVANRAQRYGIEFEGFEREYPYSWGYLENHLWYSSGKGTRSDDRAHTGNYSIKLIANNTGFFVSYLRMYYRTVAYGVKVRVWVWVNPDKPDLESSGKGINLHAVNTNSGNPWQDFGTMTKVSEAGEWVLYEKDLSTSDLGSMGITTTNYGYPNNYIECAVKITGWTGIDNYNTGDIYLDDARTGPINAEFQCYVYDDQQRMRASFDDQHFALIYDYNAEGALVRKRKETANGIKTITETNYNSKGN